MTVGRMNSDESRQQHFEAVARWVAESWLASQPQRVSEWLSAATTSPNSGLLLLYQHGKHIASRFETRGENEPVDSFCEPQKAVYLPVAVMQDSLGVELPVFTYDKLQDIVVVVDWVSKGEKRRGNTMPPSSTHRRPT